MKKNTLLLLAAAGVGIYLFMQMRRRRGVVTVSDAEIISEEEFARAQPSIPETSVLDRVVSITSKLFPPKTAEQKAAKRAAKAPSPKAVPSAVPIQFRGLATAAAAAQAAAKKKKRAKVGNVDMLSVLV